MTRSLISDREAEVHALTLWVEPECRALGEWVLRTVAAAPGLRLPRTNSCLAVGDPGSALPDAIESVRRCYRSIDRTPMVQVKVGSESAGSWSTSPTAGWGMPRL